VVNSPAHSARRFFVAHGGALLVAVAVLVRIPFLTMVLCGEEGEIGRAVTTVIEGRRPALVIARDLHGKEYAKPPLHNLGGYLLPAVVFAPALRWTGFSTVEERIRAAAALRAAYLLLYGGALVAALSMVPVARRTLAGLFLLVFSAFPLPLLGSVQVQYDGSVSTFLVVLSAALVVRAMAGEPVRPALLGLAGFFISLGKLEYVLSGAAAVAVLAIVDRRPRVLVVFLAGVALGTLSCGLWDGENLLGGYRVLRHFHDLMAPYPPGVRVPAYLRESAPYLWPLYLALPWVAAACLIDRNGRGLATPALTAVLIFAGYAEIGWHGDGFPRYFAPCFVLVPVALSRLSLPTRWLAVGAAALALPAIASYRGELEAGSFALCRRISAACDWRASARALESAPGPCVPRLGMESAIGFYSRTAPFCCCGADWDHEWPVLEAQLCE
jgi:hypothetical protein